MDQRLSFFFVLIIFLSSLNLFAISMVYNFRIAQITRPQLAAREQGENNTVIALFFDQYRKKYTGTRQNFGGGLGSYIYDFADNYFRIDGAVAHIKENEDCLTTFSGTETDDLLFTGGHNFAINQKASLSFSGLLGIPTHKLYRLQHVDFGYSQVGMGLQIDGVYSFERKGTLIYGTRYIYFVPRTAYDADCQRYTFTLGNLYDLLLAYKNNWGKNGLEFGYTSKFRFGCHVCPNLDNITKKTNYIRSNFYLVYKYKFSIRETRDRLLFYISYGFDHQSKIYGNKNIVTVWSSWSISF
jgi:hypothetical protein